jgi:hypothetical protein
VPQKNFIIFLRAMYQAQTQAGQGKADALNMAMNKKTKKFLLNVW